MLNQFELLAPKTVAEAIKMYQEHPECKVLAGGTDIFVDMHAGKEIPCLLDLKCVNELKGISWSEKEGLSFGALTTYAELERFEPVCKYYPAFIDCIRKTGSVQVRTRGTIAGNICTASPAGDSSAALLIYDAVVRIQGHEGERDVPIAEFFTGYKQTVLKDGEIVTRILIPAPAKRSGSYSVKLARRKAMDIGIICAAVCIACDDSDVCTKARIALLSAAPTPIRVYEAEKYMVGKKISEEVMKQAGALAFEAAQPKTWRSSEEYSKDMVKVLVPQTINNALQRMNGNTVRELFPISPCDASTCEHGKEGER
jgi:CO/xanthine dehydrogenase FAD-binding subunit